MAMTHKIASRIASGFLGLGLLVGLMMPQMANAQSKPVVVELFTSQGCSSCPPADALLGDLARRDDVIAVAYHVDYWNRLGWVDRYSSKWATELQSAYSRAHGRRNNYTPQMVIQGETDEIGSRRNDVLETIATYQKSSRPNVPVRILKKPDNQLQVGVDGMDHGVEAEIILLRFKRHERQPIGSGENAGRTLNHYNVVYERRILGRWRGEPVSFDVAAPQETDNSGLAVLVQARNHGPILGAGKFVSASLN